MNDNITRKYEDKTDDYYTMNQPCSWNEFQDNGLLWFINTILHLFGWAISIERDAETQNIIDVYPARTKFRGFSEDINTKGYRNVSKFLKNNIVDLYNEANEKGEEDEQHTT